jgi:hypothetical protein
MREFVAFALGFALLAAASIENERPVREAQTRVIGERVAADGGDPDGAARALR